MIVLKTISSHNTIWRTVATAMLIMVLISASYAQQVPLYGQYFYNPFIYNPAFTGSDNVTNVFLIHRAQWLDMPGHPVSTALTLDGAIKPKKIGVGVSIYSDKTDFTDRIGVYGSFAYNLQIKESHNLLFGLSLGGLQNRVDFNKAVARDLDDPALIGGYQKSTSIDGNFGIAYHWKSLKIGISVPQIIGTSFKYEGSNTRTYYDLSRHYLASLQYQIFVNSSKDISITPLIMTRFMPEAPIQYDINAIFEYKDFAWLAVSYRSDYAIGVNLKLKVAKSISVGYTYDIITSSIKAYSGMSHEFLLGYSFGGTKEMDEELKKKYEDQIDSLQAALEAQDAAELQRQQEITERYNLLINVADSLFEAGKYLEAKEIYEKALELKPDEQHPKDKLAEIASLMGDNYQRAIAKADELFKGRDYKGARKMYEEALKYNPNDAYAKDRITKINKILELFEKRYNMIIKAADELFMQKKYKLAREKYEEALKFDPSSRYAKDMIQMIKSNKTGGEIRMTDSKDFLDEFGNPAAKGFYVVMAAFKSQENADRLVAKKGYRRLFNKVRGFHYVYLKRLDTYEDSKQLLLDKARKTATDSWIYILR